MDFRRIGQRRGVWISRGHSDRAVVLPLWRNLFDDGPGYRRVNGGMLTRGRSAAEAGTVFGGRVCCGGGGRWYRVDVVELHRGGVEFESVDCAKARFVQSGKCAGRRR